MGAAVDRVPNLKLKIRIGNKRIEAGPATHSSDLGENLSMRNCVKPSQPNAKKRMPQNLEGEKVKRQRMGDSVKQHCSCILKKLRSHPAGWVFNDPVDPIALNIPDYFSIITNPMDLGTVKSRLDSNAYFNAAKFAADVRLTFSNAMVYNPSCDAVYGMAKELSNFFEARWKSVEAKMNLERLKTGPEQVPCGRTHQTQSSRQTGCRIPCNILSRDSMTFEEKQKPRKKQMEISKGTMAMAPCLNSYPQNSLPKYSENILKVVCKHGSSCSTCQCHRQCASTDGSSRDLSSEISFSEDVFLAKNTLDSRISRCDPDPDGAVSCLDEEHSCPVSQLTAHATDDASAKGYEDPVLGVQLSPSKALRAAMLKSRFGDLILKAQQKLLLLHGKLDPQKMQQEKDTLTRKQLEEKARIEAQIRAVEAASILKAQEESKLQIQRKREAARLALQQMEKNVEIDDNLKSLKDLAVLSGFSASSYLFSFSHLSDKVCRTYGLSLKHDYLEDEDDTEEREEGEIY